MLKDPLKSHTAINKDKRLKDKPKPKQLICQICENIFSSNQDKLKHCNEEHKGNQVKCNKNECSCNKLFKARKGLRRHLKRGNAFTCKFCKATFSTKQERSEHCRNDHVYQYTCKQENCGELFESKVDLFYHASKEHKYMVKKWWTCDKLSLIIVECSWLPVVFNDSPSHRLTSHGGGGGEKIRHS